MFDLQIIIPRTPSGYEIRIKNHYEIWKWEKEAREPKFIIENIRFPHDPLWRERYFCLTTVSDVIAGKCAALGPTIFWRTVEVLFASGAVAPYLIKMIY